MLNKMYCSLYKQKSEQNSVRSASYILSPSSYQLPYLFCLKFRTRATFSLFELGQLFSEHNNHSGEFIVKSLKLEQNKFPQVSILMFCF